MTATVQDLIEEAVALRDLLSDHIMGLQSLPALKLSDPVAAAVPSGANDSHRHEAEDVLPVGRLRHTPYRRSTPEQRREFALTVLSEQVDWLVPRDYAEQHHSGDPAAARYYRGVLQGEMTLLLNEGLVEVRSTGKRGSRYKYRLKKEA